MIVTLLLVLLFSIFIFSLLKRRAVCYSLLLALVTLFILIATGVMPAFLLGKLQSGYTLKPDVEWGENNVIVLMGGGNQQVASSGVIQPALNSYGRIYEAAVQYRDCKSQHKDCTIIISGGDPAGRGEAESTTYKESLRKLGIAADDVIIEIYSSNTWQNAKYSCQLIKAHQFDNIVLVTSATHLRRSELFFNHFSVTVTPIRADYVMPLFALVPTAYNFALMDIALHEYIGGLLIPLYEYRDTHTAANILPTMTGV